MRTIMLSDDVQVIGRAGEQGGITVTFDVASWKEQYADGVGGMMCTRTDGRMIPLEATTTGNLMAAVLPDECLSRPGQYIYRVTWVQAGTLRFSQICRGIVLSTGDGRGIPPDRPGTPQWATDIFIKAEQIDVALDAALQLEQFATDAEAAKEAAETAQGKAEDAQEAAEAAQAAAEHAAETITTATVAETKEYLDIE